MPATPGETLRRLRTAALVAGAAACVGGGASQRAGRPAAGQPPAAPLTERGVRALDSMWARMYATHDTALAGALYADRLEFTSANGRRKTKPEEMADVRPAPGLVMELFRTAPDSVRLTPELGTVHGVAWWRFSVGGQPREIRRRYRLEVVPGGPLGGQVVRVTMGQAP